MPTSTTPGLREALAARDRQKKAVEAYDRQIAALGPKLQETISRAGQQWWVKPSVLVKLIEQSATEEDLNFVGGLAAELDDDELLSAAEQKMADLKEIARKKKDKGFQWGDIADVGKGAVRLLGSAVESPWQEVQGMFRQQVAAAKALSEGSQPSDDPWNNSQQYQSPLAGLTRGIEGEGYVGSQSSFGITIDKMLSGDVSPGEVLFGDPDATGGGYFTGGAVREEQRSRAFRSANINGQSLTPGRLVASAVSDPDDWKYDWLSGAIDGGLIVVADPANLALGQVGKAVKARRYFRPQEERRILGLVSGQRKSVTEVADKWLTSSRPGARFIDRLTEMDNPVDIFEGSRRQIPIEWAVRLADEPDREKVLELARGFLGTEVSRKPKGWHLSTGGIAVRNFTTDSSGLSRMFGEMPRSGGMLDSYDPQAFVAQYADTLKNAHVPPEVAKPLVEQAMRAMSSGATSGVPLASDRYAVLRSVQDAVRAQLATAGVSTSRGDRYSRVWDTYDRLRSYNIDVMTGTERTLPDLVVAGNTVTAPTPQALEQLLSRYIPMPDAKTVRAIAARTSKLAGLPGGQKMASAKIGVGLATDQLGKVWKPLQLIRAAYILRVNGDEQARMAASGMSSFFSSPVSYMALAVMDDGRLGKLFDSVPGVTVGRYGTDVTGAKFATTGPQRGARMEAFDDDSEFANTLYQGASDLLFGQKTTRIPAFIPIAKGERGFNEAWLDEVKFLHDNQIARRIAAGENIDDIKEWYFTSGHRAATIGSANHARFVAETPGAAKAGDAGPLARQVSSREGADAYVDHMQQWVTDVTGGDTSLLHGVATGRFPDGATHTARSGKLGSGTAIHRNMAPTKEALAYVEDLAATGYSPAFMRGAPQAEISANAIDWANDFMSLAMDVVAVRPSNWASRSPTFRQLYWKRVEDLFDLASPTARTTMLGHAAGEAKLPKDAIKRLEQISSTGTLDVDDINALASQYAADETKKLLYDLHNRGRFFDAARLIFPFGEAWKEVMTTWSKILSENPKSLRTLQKTIEGARGAGFIYRDETTGEDMYTIPGSKALVKAFTGINGDFRASTAGLSIAGSVTPGVGPALQWGVGTFLPDKPEFKFVRDLVFQFGGEDQGIVQTFAPGWAEKLMKWGASPDSDRQFNAAVGESLNALSASGEYDLQDDKDLERLQDDAVSTARRIFMLRGFLQFVAPSAPQARLRIATQEGDKVNSYLREAFYKLQETNYETAVETFIERFGQQALIAAVPFTVAEKDGRKLYGVRPTEAFNEFEQKHRALFKSFGNVAGLFGPQDAGYDYQVYERQARAFRQPKSSKERLEDMNTMLGRMALDGYKKQMPAKPTKEQQRWLADRRRELIAEYPGYNPKDFNLGEVDGAIDELRRAVKHRSLKDNEVASAVRIYFAEREKAIEAAPDTGWQTANGSRYLRDWLRVRADEIADDIPGFRRVWDQLFSRELADDIDPIEKAA